jgi:hypothetical protein
MTARRGSFDRMSGRRAPSLKEVGEGPDLPLRAQRSARGQSTTHKRVGRARSLNYNRTECRRRAFPSPQHFPIREARRISPCRCGCTGKGLASRQYRDALFTALIRSIFAHPDCPLRARCGHCWRRNEEWAKHRRPLAIGRSLVAGAARDSPDRTFQVNPSSLLLQFLQLTRECR